MVGETGFGLFIASTAMRSRSASTIAPCAIRPAEDNAELAGPPVAGDDVSGTMYERLQYAGNSLQGCVGVGFPLTLVVGAEMVDLDHDDRHALPLARGAAPLALEELLEVLLGVESGNGIDGRVTNELLLGDVQLVGLLLERRLQLIFADLPAPQPERIPGSDEKGSDEGKYIQHSPAVF
jgi:hypothetical protein